MWRWLTATAILAAVVAGVTARAPAQGSSCASLGEAANWDAFSKGDLAMSNTTLAGRAAGGGTVTVSQIDIGGQTPSGLDLVSGGDLVANPGGGTVRGDVRYGGAAPNPANLTIQGTSTKGDPPFSFASEFTSLAALSASLAARANTAGAGYDVNIYSHAITFTAPAAALNVINVDGAQLAGAAGVIVSAPAGATVLINVQGPPALTVPLGYMNLSGGIDATRIIWNFSGVDDFTVAGSGQWEGTLLAPVTRVHKTGGGQNWHGQVIAQSAAINSLTVLHAPFGGCLPPPPPGPKLEIAGLCVESPDRLVARLRNLETHALNGVAWSDRDGAASGTVDIPASSDYFLGVDGGAGHTIEARSGSTVVTTQPVSRRCKGTISVTKRATGAPAGLTWPIAVFAANQEVVHQEDLADGGSYSVTVPGGFATGTSVGIGEVPGGVLYAVVERETHGAIASVSRFPVVVTDSPPAQPIDVVVTNECAPGACAAPTPEPTPTPTSTPEPTPTSTPTPTPTPTPTATATAEPTATPQPPQPPSVLPDQPVLPPGAPNPPLGPPLVPGSPPAADLAVTQRALPRRLLVGETVALLIRVRNVGELPAAGVVAREVPQYPNRHAEQVAHLRSLTTSKGSCRGPRPVRCVLGTLRPGAVVTIHARAQVLVSGRLESVILASGTTPESNLTNNVAIAGLHALEQAFRLRVRVAAPATGRVGASLAYRVTVAPSASAHSVRLCARVPSSLTGARAAHTFRYRGMLCRDFSRIAAGAAPGFTVHAVPVTGGTLRLPGLAAAPDALRPGFARAHVRVGAVACGASRSGRSAACRGLAPGPRL